MSVVHFKIFNCNFFDKQLINSIHILYTKTISGKQENTTILLLLTIITQFAVLVIEVMLKSVIYFCFFPRFFYKHFCKCMVWMCCPNFHTKKSLSTEKKIDEIDAENGNTSYVAETEDEEVRVPVFVSLGIIALYIFGGSVLFSTWEESWDWVVGSYFCFVTLSTIGFGDFVFGSGGQLEDSTEKLIICAVYLVLGLAILAMGFNLMQEEVKAKCIWLGKKLGIID